MHIKRILFSSLLFLLCFQLLEGCKSKSTSSEVVTVSILPLQDFVQHIAGDAVRVNVLIRPGESHASCDFSVSQLKDLKQSKLCFTIGEMAFEKSQLFPLLEDQSTTRLIKLADSCALLTMTSDCCGHHHEADEEADHDDAVCDSHGDSSVIVHSDSIRGVMVDPHIWMSPKNALKIVTGIYTELCKTYPEHKDVFTQNYTTYVDSIQQVATELQQTLATKTGKSFIIYHPALAYFAADYGLHQIAIENEGKTPSPITLARVIEQAKAEDIHLVLIQSQFDHANASSVAKSINGEVKSINPLTEHWIEEMRNLSQIMQENL